MRDFKNTGIGLRWNNFFRVYFILPRLRRGIKNANFSLLANNCNGGFIYHDLGLQFRSPTINMYFIHDHFLRFLEDFDYYISQELVKCKYPTFTEPNNSPICNLGSGDKKIELHFLHYHSFSECCELWEKRKKRLNKNNLFIVMAAFDKAEEECVKRFDNLPFKNKVIFIERPMPAYKSAYYIKGYEHTGLGVLSRFSGFCGKRIFDQFVLLNGLIQMVE